MRVIVFRSPHDRPPDVERRIAFRIFQCRRLQGWSWGLTEDFAEATKELGEFLLDTAIVGRLGYDNIL